MTGFTLKTGLTVTDNKTGAVMKGVFANISTGQLNITDSTVNINVNFYSNEEASENFNAFKRESFLVENGDYDKYFKIDGNPEVSIDAQIVGQAYAYLKNVERPTGNIVAGVPEMEKVFINYNFNA